MPGFNGSGTYVRNYNWQNDAAASIKIRADRMDTEDDGFATGLSTCVTKDGQTTTTARIPFAAGLSAMVGTTSGVSYSFTGDNNTGIYSPAADKVGIVAGGTEQLRIESALVAPIANNTVDLGSSTYKFKDGYFAGNIVGTWAGGVVAGAYGGTGVDNTGKTITLGGNFTTSGAYALTATLTNTTSVTFPTTGTLATLAGSESLTNKSVNGVTLTTGGSSSQFLNGAGSYVAITQKILQVVGATDSTQRTTTSATFVTGSNTLSVAITPSSASNKVLVFATFFGGTSDSDTASSYFTLQRGSTNLGGSNGMAGIESNFDGRMYVPVSLMFLDSPSTTSSTTYAVYMRADSGSTAYINPEGNVTASIIAVEVSA